MKGSGLSDSPSSSPGPLLPQTDGHRILGKITNYGPGGSQELGNMVLGRFCGNWVKMLREVSKYTFIAFIKFKASRLNTWSLKFRSFCPNIKITLLPPWWCCLSPLSLLSPGCRDSEEVRDSSQGDTRPSPAQGAESPLSHCVWLLIKAAMIIQSWSPEGASN